MSRSIDVALELYVDGDLGAAGDVVRRARSALAAVFGDAYDLRVVDADATPQVCAASGVDHFPTLIRIWPAPAVVMSDLDHDTDVLTQHLATELLGLSGSELSSGTPGAAGGELHHSVTSH